MNKLKQPKLIEQRKRLLSNQAYELQNEQANDQNHTYEDSILKSPTPHKRFTSDLEAQNSLKYVESKSHVLLANPMSPDVQRRTILAKRADTFTAEGELTNRQTAPVYPIIAR